MSLIRWEPFRETEEFFNRMMPSMLRRWPVMPGANDGAAAGHWAPTEDISETESEYVIRAELPAVKKEDVKVTVHDATITIEDTRRYEKEIQNEKFHRVGSLQGKFLRSFLLPADANQQSIRAESKNGVLVVRVPKAKVEQRKAVQVKVD